MNDRRPEKLSADSCGDLIAIARRAIGLELDAATPPDPPPEQGPSPSCGAFVTLRIGGALRGCIGTMSSTAPLRDLIADMARSSAFSDPRFPPLTAAEFRQVEIEISLLSPLEPVASPEDIVPGVHGVLIRGRGRSGVLLPQVATEYGWDRRTLLEQVCRKAGLAKEAYLESQVELLRFTAVLCSEESNQ
jgi:AmmeMemoRadiSam system protein A